MSGLLDLANRLEDVEERIVEVTVRAYGEVIGEEMLQDAEDHRYTGKLADTIRIVEAQDLVDLITQDYRQFVGRFRKGIPQRTLRRCRAVAAERRAGLYRGGL